MLARRDGMERLLAGLSEFHRRSDSTGSSKIELRLEWKESADMSFHLATFRLLTASKAAADGKEIRDGSPAERGDTLLEACCRGSRISEDGVVRFIFDLTVVAVVVCSCYLLLR